MSGWRCPLCGCTAYERVIVAKANGTTYLTEFHQCTACSAMFKHPGRFARLGVPLRRWAGGVGPKTPAEAQRYWGEAQGKGD